MTIFVSTCQTILHYWISPLCHSWCVSCCTYSLWFHVDSFSFWAHIPYRYSVLFYLPICLYVWLSTFNNVNDVQAWLNLEDTYVHINHDIVTHSMWKYSSGDQNISTMELCFAWSFIRRMSHWNLFQALYLAWCLLSKAMRGNNACFATCGYF